MYGQLQHDKTAQPPRTVGSVLSHKQQQRASDMRSSREVSQFVDDHNKEHLTRPSKNVICVPCLCACVVYPYVICSLSPVLFTVCKVSDLTETVRARAVGAMKSGSLFALRLGESSPVITRARRAVASFVHCCDFGVGLLV